jgi:hypothetical protein
MQRRWLHRGASIHNLWIGKAGRGGMQAFHDFLLSMDEINRDLFVNALLLAFDLLILAMLLPGFIEWIENRKWRAMRQSLLIATIDLLDSAFADQPWQPGEGYADQRTYAALDQAVFGKLQLFASALTPDQSAAVAKMVETSLTTAIQLNDLRKTTAMLENAVRQTSRPDDSKAHLEYGLVRLAEKMLEAAIRIDMLPVESSGRAVALHFADKQVRAEQNARIDRLVEARDRELAYSAEWFGRLVKLSPRSAATALSRHKADVTIPRHFEQMRGWTQDIFAGWDAEAEAES